MNCPKCKAILKEHTSIKGMLFWKKKKVITFCPICDFRNEQIFSLSGLDKEQELRKRESELELEKIEKQNTRIHKKDSSYKEDKDYKREDI